MKRCADCQQIKNPEEFNTDKRSKDGMQSYCKECKKKRQILRTEGKIEPRHVVRQHKVMKLARSLADGNELPEAYHKLGMTKNTRVAASAANNFLSSMNNNEMELFRKMLTPPKILQSVAGFFERVLTDEIESTIDERLKTITTWGRFAGTFAPEKVETASITTSAEIRTSTLEEVAKMLEAKDKENYVTEIESAKSPDEGKGGK